MAKNDALFQSHSASIGAMETQLGQMTSALKVLAQGKPPSDTENNPKAGTIEQCKSETLRSRKEVKGPTITQEAEKKQKDQIQNKEAKEEEKALFTPPQPFPEHIQKHKLDKQFQ